MRGSRCENQVFAQHAGIIPAHAGLTSGSISSQKWYWDNPRACGAHLIRTLDYLQPSGSSPRMRGSRSGRHIRLATGGIIPAHAGLTMLYTPAVCYPWDHPRACGAHYLSLVYVFHCLGSSPRMRGSQFEMLYIISPPGIIPAHAGLTSSQSATRPV